MAQDKEKLEVDEATSEDILDDEATVEEDCSTEASTEEEKGSQETNESDKPEEIDWQDKFVRLHAEWDNYRKRMDEQRADERTRATERLMSDLLVCVDDMQRSIDYAEEHGEGDLLNGVKAVYQKFTDLLSQHGLVEINPIDEPFDPLTAQAVGTVEDPTVYDETVREVYQKGYKLGIKVLRPAMVTYATGGEKRPTEDNETTESTCEEESE